MSKFYIGLVFIVFISCSSRNEKEINRLSNRLYKVKSQFEKIDPNFTNIHVFVSSPRLKTVAESVGFESISLLAAADDNSIASGLESPNG